MTLNHREFCCWLEGYLDGRGTLNKNDQDNILKKLKVVNGTVVTETGFAATYTIPICAPSTEAYVSAQHS